MTIDTDLRDERNYLAGLLEAIQRCVYFLDAASKNTPWPLTGQLLHAAQSYFVRRAG